MVWFVRQYRVQCIQEEYNCTQYVLVCHQFDALFLVWQEHWESAIPKSQKSSGTTPGIRSQNKFEQEQARNQQATVWCHPCLIIANSCFLFNLSASRIL